MILWFWNVERASWRDAGSVVNGHRVVGARLRGIGGRLLSSRAADRA